MDENLFFLLIVLLVIGIFTSVVTQQANQPGVTIAGPETTVLTINGQRLASTQERDVRSFSYLGGDRFAQSVSGNAPRFGGVTIIKNPSSGSSDAADTPPQLTNREIQQQLEELYDEAWELEQAVDRAIRREPTSRYRDYVQLRASRVGSTDPNDEYLTLSLASNAPEINISDWYLESLVTEKRMNIPDGSYLYRENVTRNVQQPIVLQPRQRAFLFTGESPLRTSFQENACMGYIERENDISPSLTRSCPRPLELMERYDDIALDDDSCYSFVGSVGRCERIEYDDPRLDDLSRNCRNFVRNYLTYENCVAQFSWRTDFYDENDWYVYFDRDEEYWRSVREIIRLIDEYDEVVAVIEY